MSARFRKTGERATPDGLVEEYAMEVAPGHIVMRVDTTSRLGAGRKGRAAEVTLHRTLVCTCGGTVSYGGLSVREDLANLKHFDSPAEKAAYDAENAAKAAAIRKALGLDS